jgi:hypothetical protein
MTCLDVVSKMIADGTAKLRKLRETTRGATAFSSAVVNAPLEGVDQAREVHRGACGASHAEQFGQSA